MRERSRMNGPRVSREARNDCRNISLALALLLGSNCGIWGLNTNLCLKEAGVGVLISQNCRVDSALSSQLPTESTND